MLHFRPTSSSNLLSPVGPFCIFSLYPLTAVPCSWLSFYASCLHSPLTLSDFSNGMLVVFEPGALNYFTFFRPILLTLSVSRNPILTHLPFSGFSALRFDRTHSRSVILSPDATHASSSVIIFIRQGLFFSELSISSLSSLNSYSVYVGVNITLKNSSSLSFLMCTPLLFAPL